MNKLVSIIMPSFNTAEYIGQSIESVYAQTYKNWELIIVDDASTDNTDNVVQEYLADDRVIYYKNTSNQGAAVCRNIALSIAKGNWIAFLDSDDIWMPQKLEKQIKFMAENRYQFSYTDYEEIDDKGNALDVMVSGPRRITRRSMRRYCWPGCLTVMYDMAFIGLVQISDIKKNNDYAIWLKICDRADCYLLEENLARYRKRVGSISRRSICTMIVWHYKLWNEVEGQNPLHACVSTLRNLIFGFIKKTQYVEKKKAQ